MTKPRARDLGLPFRGTPGRLTGIVNVGGAATVLQSYLESWHQKCPDPMLTKWRAKVALLAILTACSACVPEPVPVESIMDAGTGLLTPTVASLSAHAVTSSVCNGVQPFGKSDTVTAIGNVIVYRQAFACTERFQTTMCPAWILSKDGSACEGPIGLSPVGVADGPGLSPRLLSDGRMSYQPVEYESENGTILIFQSETTFEIVPLRS